MFKIKKRGLLLIAGIVWLAAGVNILRIGIKAILSSWGNEAFLLQVLLPVFILLVFVSFSFMFYRIVGKHEARIMGYNEEKKSIFLFFDLKGYVMMLFMMGLGLTLRYSDLLPDYFFSFFYTGLGGALSLSGFRFIARFLD